MKLCNCPRRRTRLAVTVVALTAVFALWAAPGALAGNQDITTEVGTIEVGGVAVGSVTLSNSSGDPRTFSVFIDRSVDVVVSAGFTTDCPATPPPHPSEGPFTLPAGGTCHVLFRLDAHAASVVTSTQQIYFGCTAGNCFAHPASSFTSYVHFRVTVIPPEPPIFPALSTVSAVASSPLGATVGCSVTAVDAVDGPITALCSPPSGSFFPPGLTLVTCRADDNSGHTGLASFYVHVGFGGPPSVSVPASLTVRSSSPVGRLVTYPSIGLDRLGRTLPTNCSNPSGSFFPVGTTTVTCFAPDAAGDVGSTSFALTVEAAPSSINSGPAPASFASTTTQDAPFSWSTAVRGQRTVCSLDGAPYAPCSSPRTDHGLAAGGARVLRGGRRQRHTRGDPRLLHLGDCGAGRADRDAHAGFRVRARRRLRLERRPEWRPLRVRARLRDVRGVQWAAHLHVSCVCGRAGQAGPTTAPATPPSRPRSATAASSAWCGCRPGSG